MKGNTTCSDFWSQKYYFNTTKIGEVRMTMYETYSVNY
jgi:hypothetical protein